MMKKTPALLSVLAALAIAPLPAAAAPLVVLGGVLSTYGVVTFGDMGSATNPYSSDSQGPVAVGGNAYFQDFTVAGVTNNGVNALTVGGNLTQLRAQVGGNVFVGGNADFHDGSQGGATIFGSLTVNGTLINAPTQYVSGPFTGTNPINFSSWQSDIASASTFLSAGNYGTTGNVVYQNQWNQKELSLNGADASLNIFNLSGSLLGQIGGVQPDYSDGGGSFHINIPTGSSAIINVSGVNVNFGHPGNFGFFCNGVNCQESGASNVLFNFYEAQTVDMQSVFGSILAPFADITYTNGQAQGTVIANSIGGPLYRTGEFHFVPYTGLLAVPAPSSAMTFLVGLIALVGISRRRNASV
jgi:choice-of-anchor A domain-containing protein